MLGGEDLVKDRFGLVLVRAFGEGQFAHQNLTRLREHPLLACGQPALAIAAPQVANDFCHLVDVARRQLLEVRLVPARPVGGLFGVRRAKHLEHPIKALLAHDVADTDKLGVVSGNPNREVTLSYFKDEVNALLAIDYTTLDGFDQCSPVMGVDNCLADVERHVALVPSAAPILPRKTGPRERRSAYLRRSEPW